MMNYPDENLSIEEVIEERNKLRMENKVLQIEIIEWRTANEINERNIQTLVADILAAEAMCGRFHSAIQALLDAISAVGYELDDTYKETPWFEKLFNVVGQVKNIFP
jgi:hypothetical protein